MKKALAIVLCVAAAAFVFGADKVVELKFGHYNAESHPMHLAAVAFADGVAARTQGAVKVTIFANSKLGSSQEMLEQATLGAIDLVIPTDSAVAKYSTKFNLVGAPFAFKDYAATDRFYAGEFLKWVDPDVEKAGLKNLARWEFGFRTYTNSKRPIAKPEDMRGLKIRTPPDFVNQETVKALGGVVQTIAFAELPMALKSGVVDGQENPIATIYAGKMWETQKYLTIVNYTYQSTYLLINKAAFERLTADQRAIVSEEAQKAGALMRKTIRDNEAKQIAELKANGMEVNVPDTAPFKAATTSVWDTLAKQVGEANYKAFMAMLEKSK